MNLDKGKNPSSYRELGIRFHKRIYHHKEYFVEINLWKWFITLSWIIKFKD